MKEEIEKLCNDNHNLKREIKRMEERQSAEKAERLKAQTELSRCTEEVTKESMDDIKKTNGCGPERNVIGSNDLGDVLGYRFKEEIIKAVMLLYVYSGNSFRTVTRSMGVFNFVFPFLDLKIPSYVIVRDWVQKAGLDGHKDISHTFGTFLKAVYDRDEQYVSLTKAIGNARHTPSLT